MDKKNPKGEDDYHPRTALDSKNWATSDVSPMQNVIDKYAVVVIAEFGWLVELTVPVGVGQTNGLVGVTELGLELTDVDVDERLALRVLTLVVVDVAFRATSNA